MYQVLVMPVAPGKAVAMSIEDPRNYLVIQPVPGWEVAGDAKLKARSLSHYNLGSPTRCDMFEMNYARRCKQLTSQGFRSVPWRPYQDIGDPLELDTKHLIEKTLGQEKSDSTTKQTEKYASLPTIAIHPQRLKSIQYRSDRHFQSLSENLSSMESTKVFVKRGNSLFKILDSEKISSENAHQTIEPKTVAFKETLGTKDSTLDEAVLLRKCIEILEKPTSMKSTGVSSSMPQHETQHNAHIPNQSFAPINASITKKTLQGCSIAGYKTSSYLLWRQLCALHWLIEACLHEVGVGRNLALCEKMIPLAECWNVAHPGGGKFRLVAGEQEHYIGIKWRKFMRSNGHHIPRTQGRRLTKQTISRQQSVSSEISHATYVESGSRPPSTRSLSQRTGSLSPSTVIQSPSSPTFKKTRSDSRMSMGRFSLGWSLLSSEVEASPDGKNTNEEREYQEDDSDNNPNYHVNLRKLLKTVRESVTREMMLRQQDADREARQLKRLRTPVYKWAFNLYTKSSRTAKNEKETHACDKPVPSLNPSQRKSVVKIRPHTAGPAYSGKNLVAQGGELHGTGHSESDLPTAAKRPSRPKSSPPKLSASCPLFCPAFQSDSKAEAVVKIKEQFEEVTDLKSLQLHQNLMEMDRSRCERVEKKFEAFDCRHYGMHRDLQAMRSAVSKQSEREGENGINSLSLPDAARTCKWYNVLKENIGPLNPEDKLCHAALLRIEETAARLVGWQASDAIGKTKKSRKSAFMDSGVNTEAFLTVLRRLRPFEFCAPDVSAAIEFMRDYVVKIPHEQFEQLRGQMV